MANTRGRNRKLTTFIWALALAVVTAVLVYKEMTSLLYILATLGVSAILMIVAFANLSGGEHPSGDSPPAS